MAMRVGDRIDCHVHSMFSSDGRGTLKELVHVAKEKGLTGLCVTDHNSARMAKEIQAVRFDDFLVIPGMEVSTRQGHCLALGVREEIPRGLLFVETIEKITAAGGVGVPSHPYRRINGVGEVGVLSARERVKAIEVYNARDGSKGSNRRAQGLATSNHWGGTGGSDAHQIFEVGNAFTTFKRPIGSVDDFLDEVGRARTWGRGVPTPRARLFGQNVKNLWLWTRRGFKGM